MITAEEINFINKEYSKNGGGSDPTNVLATGRLSWISNSGSRQQMFTAQVKQAVMLDNPEVARLTTGHEKHFGKYANSYKRADSDYRIVSKICRYSSSPQLSYVLVLQDVRTGVYDVVNVKHFENMTDCHGYIREDTPVDHMMPGQIIPKGEYIYKASTIDENENYRYGVNCKVAYITMPETIEDAIICSRSFAERTKFTLIEKIEFSYDTNHVMLNMYGNNNNYKCLPEIGEETFEDSILCAIRSVNKRNIASDLTIDSLKNPKGSDTIIKGRGKLIDISIHTNAADKLEEGEHRSQVRRMYLDELRYHQEIVNTLGRILSNKNNKVTDMFKYILSISRNYINPDVKFSSDSGEFEFCYITAYVAYKTGLNEGYKMTNRHGGKGVISEIRDDELMPVDEDGVRCDAIIASAGVVPRLNFCQKYEHEINFIADKFVRHKLMKEDNHDKRVKMLCEFCSDINKDYGDKMTKYLKSVSKYEQQRFIREVGEEGLYLQLPPFTDFMTIDNLAFLYDKYDIKPGYVRVRRRYYDEPESDTYVTEDYVKKLENINDNFIFPHDPKSGEIVTLGMDDLNKQKKNHVGLSPKQYKENQWVDKYVWCDVPLKYVDGKDPELTERIDSVKIVNEFKETLSKEEFDSPKTKIYKNDDGSITREFRSTHPIIIADVYYMILKHIPEAKKFSARNLGPVSLLGLPCKSNKNSIGIPYPDTSNRCGEMESECLNRRIPAIDTARWMATHATNPEYVLESARQQLFENPLDLHDVDIPGGIPKDTIPARTLRAYLASIGINVLDTGETDPFEWFDKSPFKDGDDLLNQLRKKNKSNGGK